MSDQLKSIVEQFKLQSGYRQSSDHLTKEKPRMSSGAFLLLCRISACYSSLRPSSDLVSVTSSANSISLPIGSP